MDKLALFGPDDAGENSTCTVQLPEVAIVWPEQLSLWILNSERATPVMEIAPTTRLKVPEFKTMKVCAVEELPALMPPKSWLVGETEISGIPDGPPRTGHTLDVGVKRKVEFGSMDRFDLMPIPANWNAHTAAACAPVGGSIIGGLVVRDQKGVPPLTLNP